MPLDPWGIASGTAGRIRDRIKNELGIGVPSVAPTSAPPSMAPAGTGGWAGIKNRIKQELGIGQPQPGLPLAPGQPPPPPKPAYSGPPRNLSEVKERIQKAGRSKPPMLVRMLYNGQWRDVSVFSYRYRDADDPHIPLLYGYCHKDNHIEAFKLKKIQDIQVTNRPFQPQWPVEF